MVSCRTMSSGDLIHAIAQGAQRTGGSSLLRWIPDAIRERTRALYASPYVNQERRAYIFGYGRMGQTWAKTLRRCGWTVRIWNRSAHPKVDDSGTLPQDLTADLWLLTVSDDAIEAMANRLAQGHLRLERLPCTAPFRLGSEVMGALAQNGLSVGSLHPLRSVQKMLI